MSTKTWLPTSTLKNWCCTHIHDPTIFFFNFGVCVFCDVFDGAIIRFLSNGPKNIHIENLHPSVTSGENLRSPGSQMCLQVYLISVRGQTILYWKLDRSGYFCSNGPIYIFNFAFWGTIFVCFVFCFFEKHFSLHLFLFIFLIGSDDTIDIVLLWNVFSLCLYLSLDLFISYLYDRFFIGFSLNVII